MSVFTAFKLRCDSCGATFGSGDHFSSIAGAREFARMARWKTQGDKDFCDRCPA